ncbi:Xyloglucan 6-xylosyltransferase 2 [Zea mays]|uniref:Xyloglucan 6-xylosyltransferase 2 n=1 Tax=Zea mays TaxID=4577 RepID=A0A1D6LIU8_MAIZE|nr:Xyloglucan 6-xylosyltransferase 2 [Zea mays]
MCSLAAIRGMSHPHRALAEHHDARSRASTTTTSSSSSSARRDDDPDPPPRSLKDPPYTLHCRHLETPPFLNDIKPRVLLVTGSSPKPCENPVGDHYLLKSIKNKMDYCRVHDIEWSLDKLDTWAPMGPKGPVRIEAGKVLTKSLKDRQVFEADDQSAMVYILATQREKWGDKVYLQNGYYLHGYWGILVDRYE